MQSDPPLGLVLELGSLRQLQGLFLERLLFPFLTRLYLRKVWQSRKLSPYLLVRLLLDLKLWLFLLVRPRGLLEPSVLFSQLRYRYPLVRHRSLLKYLFPTALFRKLVILGPESLERQVLRYQLFKLD